MPQMADPAESYSLVTPSDETVVGCRFLYVGGAGTVVIQPYAGATAVSFVNVPAGSYLPVQCYRVMNATTATGIVALGGRIPAFTPLHLGSSLAAWWSADDHGTARMVDDGAGVISQHNDRVGGMALNGTTTQRPLWKAASFNGFSEVLFDGVANVLFSTGIGSLPVASVGGELWLLCRQLTAGATAGTRVMMSCGTQAAASLRGLYRMSVSSVNRAAVHDGTTALTDTLADLSSYAIVGGAWAGTTEEGRINGAVFSPASATIASLNTGTTRLALGASAGLASFANIGVRHAFVTTTLTALQRQQMEGWLAWDAGLQATSILPVSHLYKTVRP